MQRFDSAHTFTDSRVDRRMMRWKTRMRERGSCRRESGGRTSAGRPFARSGPAVVALLAIGAAVPRPAHAQAGVVPIEYEDTRVYVPVRVDTLPARWFILDTGAQPVLFDVSVAAMQAATVVDAGHVRGAGSGSLRQGMLGSIPLHVGDVRLVPPRIAVSPLDSLLAPFTGHRTAGIIGSQLFTEHVVVLDIAARRLEVHDAAGFHYAGNGTVLPLRLSGGIPYVDGAITLPDGRRLPMRFLVDLGAKATLLVAEPFIDAHDVRPSLRSVRRASLGAGVGGETRYDFARLPRLEVGAGEGARAAAVALSDPVVGFSVQGTLRSSGYDALLGAGFLERFRVVFDYSRGRMILEPPSSPLPRDAFDMSGAFLIAAGPSLHRFVVHGVDADSPAAESGLRVGDVVLDVNGRPAAQLSLDEVRRVLRGETGREVTLRLQRDGDVFARTLRLRPLL